ncbi:Na+/H+ antiporter subunit E [Sediminivirga luteola]|uniref:Na+/H+ antiporter subunit E n=1 Tax=Sediminivirga luteola TaxID=1774748 RepID=UPI001F56CDFE|nr:Na+/H+ antiporter subunit E [Sediminivirga luteola]MCI2265360.1 Na+/H+ antiporter subunit E [Sediminivirga luteola]
MADTSARPARWAASLLARLLAGVVLWLAITEGSPAAFGYGAVAVPLCAAASYAITGAPGGRKDGAGSAARRSVGGRVLRSARAVAGLSGWVLWRSIAGGLDVARRALSLPAADIDPYWTSHTTRLDTTGGRVALAFVLNLMPGTLSAQLEGKRLAVHVISPEIDLHGAVSELESRIARVTGEDHPAGGDA